MYKTSQNRFSQKLSITLAKETANAKQLMRFCPVTSLILNNVCIIYLAMFLKN